MLFYSYFPQSQAKVAPQLLHQYNKSFICIHRLLYIKRDRYET